MANIPVLISLDCTFTCSEASRDKKHYFLFIFKAWHRPIYPLWLPEWSGRLWNFSVPTPLCIVISSTVLAKPRGEKAEQGIRSLKIAPRHRGLERKRLAVLHHHSAGRFFLSVLLSHTLLMFLSAVQSGGCHDIVPLGALQGVAREWTGLAARPPSADCFYTFLTRWSLLRPCGQRVHCDWAPHRLE